MGEIVGDAVGLVVDEVMGDTVMALGTVLTAGGRCVVVVLVSLLGAGG